VANNFVLNLYPSQERKTQKKKKRVCNDLNKLYFIVLKNEEQSGTSMFIALSPTEPQMEIATLNF